MEFLKCRSADCLHPQRTDGEKIMGFTKATTDCVAAASWDASRAGPLGNPPSLLHSVTFALQIALHRGHGPFLMSA